MTVRNLEFALKPRSVAVIGVRETPPSLGSVVLRNIIRGGFPGAIWPVHPARAEVMGLPCFPDVASLPAAPDIAVIATPAATVPGLISEIGAKGGRIAVVVASGFDADLRQAMLDAAKEHLLRVFGPSSAGLILP